MYARVGLQQNAVGVVAPLRAASDGSLVTVNGGGDLADAALNGRLFYAANQAAVATTASLQTTWTGLGIANPTGSGKLIVLHEFSWALTVVGPAAGALSLATATDSGLAAGSITVYCARPNYATSVAIVDNGATIVGPTLVKPISTYGTGAITTWQGAGPQVCKLEGQIIIPPGRSIVTDTTSVCSAAFIFGFLWEEVAL